VGRSRIWQRQQYFDGDVIFERGEAALSAYIVEKGRVELSTLGDTGDKIVIQELGSNELFGEMALIDKGTRSATATAVTETTCKVLHQNDFNALLERTDTFLHKLLILLSKRMRRSNEVFLES